MQPAVFLDRDDTLIRNDGDLGDPDAVELLPGVADGLRALRHAGYRLVVVTNQAGVARGAYGEEDVDRVHQRIAELVDEAAGEADLLDRFYYCPYHPDAPLEAYRRDHFWRKPRPGMLLQAARDLDLDLGASWIVGDRGRDVEAGRSAGCRSILLTATDRARAEEADARPTASCGDFASATMTILRSAQPRPRPSGSRADATAEREASAGAAATSGTTATKSPPTEADDAAPDPRRERTTTIDGPAATGAVRPATRQDPVDGARPNGVPRGDGTSRRPRAGESGGEADEGLHALQRVISDLVEDLRSERVRQSEFTGLRLAAGLMQLLVLLLALLALLQIDAEGAFAKWMAGAGLTQLTVIALLLADQRS